MPLLPEDEECLLTSFKPMRPTRRKRPIPEQQWVEMTVDEVRAYFAERGIGFDIESKFSRKIQAQIEEAQTERLRRQRAKERGD